MPEAQCKCSLHSSALLVTHFATAGACGDAKGPSGISVENPSVVPFQSVAGLVAITPASGLLNPCGPCHWASGRRDLLLDGQQKKSFWLRLMCCMVGVHGIGGRLGAILTGVFATKEVTILRMGKAMGLVDGACLPNDEPADCGRDCLGSGDCGVADFRFAMLFLVCGWIISRKWMDRSEHAWRRGLQFRGVRTRVQLKENMMIASILFIMFSFSWTRFLTPRNCNLLLRACSDRDRPFPAAGQRAHREQDRKSSG